MQVWSTDCSSHVAVSGTHWGDHVLPGNIVTAVRRSQWSSSWGSLPLLGDGVNGIIVVC